MKLRVLLALALALACAPALAQVNPGTSPLSIAKGGTAAGTASAARTSLGLAIGTNVQAWNTNLDCLAALAGNGVLQKTGSGACAALTNTALTALINLATASLSGALPAWPNNTTTFFRGDGTYQTLNAAALNGIGGGVPGALGNAANASGGILAPTPTRAGDIAYYNGSTWVTLAGNNSGTQFLQETSSGVPSWVTIAGTGTVTTPGGGLVSSTTASCSQTANQSTLSAAECVDPRTTTTETINDSDRGKLVTASNASAQAYTIAQAGASTTFQAGWFTDINNISTNPAGVVTITPTTSTIYNGQTAASSLKLAPGQGARIVSDGTNYQAIIHNLSLQGQILQASPSNPTGCATATCPLATGVMMGVGTTCKLTPAYSSRVALQFFMGVNNPSSANMVIKMFYGTGVAPSNGAAVTGTQLANLQRTLTNSSAQTSNISNGGIITGLTPGTAYWLDFSLGTDGGTASPVNVSCTVNEL